jgi:hypothetical protein
LKERENRLLVDKTDLKNLAQIEKLNRALQDENQKMLQELEVKSKEIEQKNKKIQEIEPYVSESKVFWNLALKLEARYKTIKNEFEEEIRRNVEEMRKAGTHFKSVNQTLREECDSYKEKVNTLQVENKQLAIQKDVVQRKLLMDQSLADSQFQASKATFEQSEASLKKKERDTAPEIEKLNRALQDENQMMLQELEVKSKEIEQKNKKIQEIEPYVSESKVFWNYALKLESRYKTIKNEFEEEIRRNVEEMRKAGTHFKSVNQTLREECDSYKEKVQYIAVSKEAANGNFLQLYFNF